MREASTYLDQAGETTRQKERLKNEDPEKFAEEADKIENELKREGDLPERPKHRTECPSYRPCPYVGCKYHLWADIMRGGNLKKNFYPLKPWELSESCALDVAERGESTLKEVGQKMQLTRERVRQIEREALRELSEYIDVDEFVDFYDVDDAEKPIDRSAG